MTEWISTEATLPTEDGKYLCVPRRFNGNLSSNRVSVYRFSNNLRKIDKQDFPEAKKGFFDYDRDYGFYEVEVAYWLPIPEIPKE